MMVGVMLDGYGDESPDLEQQVEEIIASRWTEGMVRGVIGRHDEDLAQEARIAMWQAAARWDGRGTLIGYLHTAARYRVKSLLAGDHKPVGQEPVRAATQRRGDESRARLRAYRATFKAEHGREPSAAEAAKELGIHEATVRKQLRTMHHTPTDVQAKVSSLEALIEAYGTEAVFEAADIYEGIVLAYHYGEIHEAVADLDPVRREYVYLRFWCGVGSKEAEREVGQVVHFERTVRPVLAERLAHLATA
jgi:DNA-directed RNA polymerase specialized sigma24 family protein